MYEKSNHNNKRKIKKRVYNKVILTGFMVLLLGILVTFTIDGMNVRHNSYNENQVDAGKDLGEENTSTEKYEGLNEVVELDGNSILTKDEIQLVKEAIKNDVSGYFKLANKENTLLENYKPDNLIIPDVGITKDRSNEQNFIRADIAHDVEAFLGAAKDAGYEIFLSSGYRSFNLQSIFYSNDLQGNGGVETGYVAAPGTSEHQLGLALDLTSHSVNLELTDDFENTPEGQWALENAHKYGFILRYKSGKEDITGYYYEPWHYRYIGNTAIAKICYEKDITLEELIELTK